MERARFLHHVCQTALSCCPAKVTGAGGRFSHIEIVIVPPISSSSRLPTSFTARGVSSRWIASRTSVTSENITASRSAPVDRGRGSVYARKRTLPPHCMPTTSSEAGQASSLPLIQFANGVRRPAKYPRPWIENRHAFHPATDNAGALLE